MGRPAHRIRQNPLAGSLAEHRDAIEEFCQKLEKRLGPCCVILHGSWARGEAKPWSDIDIAVVSDALPGDFSERWMLIGRLKPPGHGIEAIGFRTDHFEELLERGRTMALDAMEFGFALRGEEYFEKLRRRFELMKQKGVAREDVCWYIPPEALEAARLDRERESAQR
jgi:hypothetical protein